MSSVLRSSTIAVCLYLLQKPNVWDLTGSPIKVTGIKPASEILDLTSPGARGVDVKPDDGSPVPMVDLTSSTVAPPTVVVGVGGISPISTGSSADSPSPSVNSSATTEPESPLLAVAGNVNDLGNVSTPSMEATLPFAVPKCSVDSSGSVGNATTESESPGGADVSPSRALNSSSSQLGISKLLHQRWERRVTAIAAIKLVSTRGGHNIKVHRTKSGGKCVHLYCSTRGSVTDPRFACGYHAVLRKSKDATSAKPWHLKQGTETWQLEHCPRCLSKPKISTNEALVLTAPTAVGRTASSIESTRTNIVNSNKIPRSAVSQHVANETRKHHARMANKTYDIDWSKLRVWGADHVKANPESHFHVEQDAEGRFKRQFCNIGVTKNIAFHAGINFSGIDSTFFKHYHFREGQLMLLVTRDGNNQLVVLAWCICLKENADNYKYFANHCRKAGLGIYLNRAEQLLYSDRHKGIPG